VIRAPIRGPQHRDTTRWWLVVGGAVVVAAWLLVWRIEAGRWDPALWQFRDDAIITLSHARGLLDTGSVSVSASGARVSGFSAPLQFFVFLAASPVFRTSYQGFMRAQTLVGVAMLGGALLVILWRTDPGRRAMNIALGVLAPFLVLSSFRFFAWESSGMENAITNALALSVVAAMAWSLTRRRPDAVGELTVGVLALGFSLTRTEFIFHAAPLVVVYAILHYRRFRAPRLAITSLAVLAFGWLAAATVDYRYFGSLRPNTGYVEAINPIANVRALAFPLTVIGLGTVLAVRYATRTSPPRETGSHRPRILALIAVTTLIASVGVAALQRGSLAAIPGLTVIKDVYLDFMLLALIIPAAILYRFSTSRSRRVLQLLATLMVTGTVAPLLFGAVRWDATRPMSFLLPVAAAGLLVTLRDAIGRMRLAPPKLARSALGCAVVLAPALVLTWAVAGPWNQSVALCCNAKPLADQITATADRFGQAQHLPDPIVANADLGALSFRKRVNITDLGQIGDPVVAHLYQTWRPDRLARYLSDVAAPDVVEVQGTWTCTYDAWINSAQFKAQYQMVHFFRMVSCPGNPPSPDGIWQRNTTTPTAMTAAEYRFARQLAEHPTPSTIAGEVQRCATGPTRDATRCLYVTRVAYRLLPVLRRDHPIPTLVAAFRHSPSFAYDRSILESPTDGRWYERALAALRTLVT
jgi:hypothetical protein